MGGKQNYDRASEVSWLVLIFITGLVWFVSGTLIIINGKLSVKLPRKLDSLAIRPLHYSELSIMRMKITN